MKLAVVIAAALVTGCAARAPIVWDDAQIAAVQQSFRLEGEWRHTVRSGKGFGDRCDMSFEADGKYRKSCSPPVEESGRWRLDDAWDGRRVRVELDDRADLIEKLAIADATIELVVESPEGDRVTMDGVAYEKARGN